MLLYKLDDTLRVLFRLWQYVIDILADLYNAKNTPKVARHTIAD